MHEPSTLNPAVLDQILQLQSAIHATSDKRCLMDGVVWGLIEVPGVANCVMCIEGMTTENSGNFGLVDTPELTRCTLVSALSSASCTDCAEDRFVRCDGWQRFGLQTHQRVYGSLFLNIQDQASFLPYSTLVNNTAKLVALQVENHHNNVELSRLNVDREEQVKKLTQQLQETEIHLRESKKLFDDVLDAIPDMVWLKDSKGVYLTCNQELAKLVDSTKEEIIGGTDYDFFPKEKADFYADNDRKAIENRVTTVNEESADYLYAGYSIWIETSKTPIYDNHGELVGVLGIGREITKSKEALQRNRENQDFLDMVVDRSPVPMWIGSPNGTALRGNHALYSALNLTAEQTVGKYNLLKDDNLKREDIAEKIDLVLHHKQPVKFELLWKADLVRDVDFSGGRDLYMDASIFPLLNQNGEMTHIVVQWIDVTERRQAEEALRASEIAVRKKLTAITEPEGDLGTLELADIIDPDAMQLLMDDFCGTTGMCIGIADMKGNILASVGWRDICLQFHRAHPETARHCMESDTILSGGVTPGDFKLYRCKNNMWEAASPIMVGGQHMGNIFFGQYFYDDEEVDIECFRNQARRFGFDEEKYLAAVSQVPRYRRDTVEHAICFCTKLAGMVSTISYNNILLARVLSEREQAEDALKISELRLKEAQSIAMLGNFEHDFQKDTQWWSDQTFRILGFPKKKIPPNYETFIKRLSDEDKDKLNNLVERAQKYGDDYSITYSYQIPGSDLKYIDVKAQVVFDHKGKPKGLKGTAQDVTERKHAESRILENEEKFRILFENSPFGIIINQLIKDTQGKPLDFIHLQANPATSVHLGMHLSDLVGTKATEIADEETASKFIHKYGEVVRTGTPCSFEYYFSHHDRTLHVTAFHLIGDLFITTFTDITNQKNSENELRKSLDREQFLGDVIRDASVAIGIGYPDGRLQTCNQAFVRLTGYTEEELNNLDWNLTLTPPEWRDHETLYLQKLNPSHNTVCYEKEYIRKDGTRVPIELLVAARFDDVGAAVSYIGFVSDISERKQAERESAQAQAALLDHQRHETERVERELTKAKDELMGKARLAAIGQVSASMAHDLRNPLGAARNACYLLNRRLDSDQTRLSEPIEIIEEEIDRANGIITNLMAIARSREPNRENIDLGALIREVYDRLENTDDIDLQLDLDSDPFEVKVDKDLFSQVAANLLTNAVQAIEESGQIIVRACHQNTVDIIEFQDTGPGFTPEIRNNLFDPLITTKARGTGLGLTICKQIVEAHGGTIEANDHNDGGGALIRICLNKRLDHE